MKSVTVVFYLIRLICVISAADLLIRNIQNTKVDTGYLLLTPSRFISGTANRICLSRFAQTTSGTAFTQIDLLPYNSTGEQRTNDGQHYSDQTPITRIRKNFPAGNGGCFDIVIPRTTHLQLWLQFRMRLEKSPNYISNTRRLVSMQHSSSLIIIQTDKPVYRAGETVRFRVLQLKPDLTPLHLPISSVYIEAPPEQFGGSVKLVQWNNVSTQMGLMQIDYALDKYALKGDYRIVVKSEDNGNATVSETFYVSQYSLPTFYVNVLFPQNVVLTFKQIVWTVCARYMYGESMKGSLHIKVSSDAYESQVIRKVIQLQHVRGCYNYTTHTKGLGFTNSLSNAPNVVVAEINVQEEGTRVWRNGTFLSHVGRQVLKIEFVNKDKFFLRPGLPFKAKVKVSDWDNKPVLAALIKICCIPSYTNNSENDTVNKHTHEYGESCDKIYTDGKGYAHSTFDVPSDIDIKYLKLQATVIDHSLRDYEFGLQEYTSPTVTTNISIWTSPSQVYVDIGSMMVSPSGLRLDSKHLIPIYIAYGGGQAIKAVTMHFSLITRSGVIFRWGSTTQCPTPVDGAAARPPHQRHTNRNVPPGTICYGATNHTGAYRINLPLRISHQMCPYSYVVAYFECDGEIIAASKMLKVNECFYKKIHQQWIPDEVAPSSPVRLRVQTPGPALCATLVTNLALKHALPQLSTHQLVVARLNAFMDGRRDGAGVHATQQVCFESQYTNSMDTYYKNTLLPFKISSINVISDLIPETIICPSNQNNKPHDHNKPSDLTSRIVKERSYFPETWLWNSYLMYSNGTLDIETNAPDDITRYDSQVFCISRSGITCTQPGAGGILKVFQPFFVYLFVPKVVKRGEDAEMYYKVFNYIDDLITVTLSIESSSDSLILITGNVSRTRTTQLICLQAHDTRTEYFMIKAKRLGDFNVSVNAHLDNNMQYYCKRNVSLASTSYDVRDKVVKEIRVEPEGYPMEKYKSALLCTNEFNKEVNKTFLADTVDAVPDSEHWIVSIVGDIAGPITLNADKLISLPMGCGEQNMALLAYNIMALQYLTTSAHLINSVEQKTREHLLIGYQRQLTYRHRNGAFSAFGPSKDEGSTWLTAFTLKYLHKLQQYGIGWDEHMIQQTELWLTQQQMENGCFRNVGQVFHREMKGGLRSESSNVALAAYVLISLIDSGITVNKNIIQNGIYCLTALKYKPQNFKRSTTVRTGSHLDLTYTLALNTLAQIRIDQYEWNLNLANEIYPNARQLKERRTNNETFDAKDLATTIKKSDDGINVIVNVNKDSGYYYKENVKKQNPIDVGQKVVFSNITMYSVNLLKRIARRSGSMVWWEADSMSVSIETTGYAILSLLAVGGDDARLDALAAVKWLSTHRNTNGGFMSTQDTLIALEAICAVSKTVPSISPNLNVTVQGPAISHYLSVTSANKQTVQSVYVSDVRRGHKLTVRASGEGCVLIQTTQKYNSMAVSTDVKDSPFVLKSKITTDGLFGCKANKTWCKCAAILEVCVAWNHPTHESFPEMAILEVELPNGYVYDKELLYQLITTDNILLRRLEEKDEGRIIFYLSVSSLVTSPQPGECWDVYLMGIPRRTFPARVTVYDYYHTDINATQAYTVTESCPYDRNRRPHDEPVDFEVEASHLYQHITPITDQSFSDLINHRNGKDGQTVIENSTIDMKNGNIRNIQIAIDTHMAINRTKLAQENHNTSLNIENKSGKGDTTMNCTNLSYIANKNSTLSKGVDAAVNLGHISLQNSNLFLENSAIDKDMDNIKTVGDSQQTGHNTTHQNNMSSINNNSILSIISTFHIIESELDLEVPEGLEGPEVEAVLPPHSYIPPNWEAEKDFNKDENLQPYPIGHNSNWTDLDIELDVPDGLEGNQPVWLSPPNASITTELIAADGSLSDNKDS